jgi:capsular polysaccharide biosynthesis protein
MTDHPTRPHHPFLVRVRRLPRWSLIVAGTIAGGLSGGAYGVLEPPTYTATSYVVAVAAEQSGPAAALGFAQAYGRVATQVAVLSGAQRSSGVPVRTLQHSVHAATSPDAPMVAVSATSSRPALAADMANAVAAALTRHAAGAEAGTHVSLVQFARAVRPADPASASAAATGLVGASAGGLLGALALLVRPVRGRLDETACAASVPGPTPAAEVHGRR